MASDMFSQAGSSSNRHHELHKLRENEIGPADRASIVSTVEEPAAAALFPNGYHFPPKHSFSQSTREGLVAFWKFFKTPFGFCATIYGLNIVAWGGMLFLLLCNAAPAMCQPSCNHIDSPRRIWIEWDAQILNALFCVTGLGLAPWRFRDLYFLLKYRLLGHSLALRKLAIIHHGWFRLEGFETTDPPLTGVRAPATAIWKLDLVIWLAVWNTLFQVCLCVFMWHMDRYTRPSWATGLFIGLAMVVAAVAGFITFLEGRAIKSVEGVPVSDVDLQRLERDREQGIYHFNNMGDRDMASKRGRK